MKLKLWLKWLGHPQRGAAPLSFVVLVAYDYKYLPPVIKSLYSIADEIFLGLDRDRISFAGNPFNFNTAEFQSMIRELDPDGKIRVVEEDFHSGSDPMDSETRERNYLSQFCRKGNWIIQIDSDEILLNPEEFKAWIDAGNGSGLILAHWIFVYKKIGDELLVVDKETYIHAVGTRLRDGYIGARYTGQNKTVSPLRLLHFAYGRTPEEMWVKLKNWSHSHQVDADKYFALWNSVGLDNYTEFKNLHPLDGVDWPKLKKIKDPGLY